MFTEEEKRRRWQRVRALSIALQSELGVLAPICPVAHALKVTAGAVVINASIEMAAPEHGEDVPARD